MKKLNVIIGLMLISVFASCEKDNDNLINIDNINNTSKIGVTMKAPYDVKQENLWNKNTENVPDADLVKTGLVVQLENNGDAIEQSSFHSVSDTDIDFTVEKDDDYEIWISPDSIPALSNKVNLFGKSATLDNTEGDITATVTVTNNEVSMLTFDENADIDSYSVTIYQAADEFQLILAVAGSGTSSVTGGRIYFYPDGQPELSSDWGAQDIMDLSSDVVYDDNLDNVAIKITVNYNDTESKEYWMGHPVADNNIPSVTLSKGKKYTLDFQPDSDIDLSIKVGNIGLEVVEIDLDTTN